MSPRRQNLSPHPHTRGGIVGRVPVASFWIIGLMALASVTSVVILVIDHFNRVDDFLIFFSSAFLLGSVALLCGLGLAANRALASAAKAEAIRSASVESANYGVITTDADGVILEWNAAASRIFGYDRSDAVGRDAISLIVPSEQEEDVRLNFEAIAEGSSDLGLGEYLEVQFRDALDRVFPVELSVTRIPGDPPMFTMFTRSLTEHRLREEENRRLADIVRSSEDAIISVDLNGRVTSWNRGAEAIYGYSEDEAVTKRLNDLTSPSESDNQELGSLFRRVLNGIPGEMTSERRTRDGQSLWVTSRAFPIRNVEGNVSGMSLITRDITERHRRDLESARDGERRHWQDLIEESLAESGFTLWGQPVYRVSDGAVSHHELLLRMQRKNGEIVLPGSFLPIAEESDLISRIDRWVIERGVSIGRSIPVAINLSGLSVSDTELGAVIAGAVESSGVDPGHLRFEFTESAAIENLTAARKLVDDLKALGCLVSLDDFGTGYGSFTYLKHLPVDEIKIDATFVQDVTTDDASRRVVNSLVSVARAFSMSTIAEGIEDEATHRAVVELGIDLAQGFHLGRPGPLDLPGQNGSSGVGCSADQTSL